MYPVWYSGKGELFPKRARRLRRARVNHVLETLDFWGLIARSHGSFSEGVRNE